MRRADVQVRHRTADRFDGPDVRGRASPVATVSAGRVEVDRRDLDRDAVRLCRSIREDGTHRPKFDRSRPSAQMVTGRSFKTRLGSRLWADLKESSLVR